MNTQMVVAVVLTVLLAASAYAQTTDFFELAKTGTPQDVQAAISKGADVNAQGDAGLTALMFAAGNNQNPKVITTLLKAGAAVNAQNIYGATALMLAAEYNKNSKVITTLLRAGADMRRKDNEGKTAFDYAKDNDKLKGTDALLQLQKASQ